MAQPGSRTLCFGFFLLTRNYLIHIHGFSITILNMIDLPEILRMELHFEVLRHSAFMERRMQVSALSAWSDESQVDFQEANEGL